MGPSDHHPSRKEFLYYVPVILQKVGYVVFFILHKIFVCIEIKGKENLKNLKGPIIIAANHTSELDVTSIQLTFPFFSSLFPIYFVSDPKERFKTFGWRNYIYGGIFFNTLGGYPIHPGFHDYAISLENHLELLEQGRTIFIFPEGKRTPDGTVGMAHGGLGFMVFETGAKVVPIAINTFFNMSWKEYFFGQRKVIITVLPPMEEKEIITALEPTVEDFRAGSKAVMDKIGEALKK